MEGIDFNALGGTDTVTVHDLTGTGVSRVDLNLGASGGGGDGQADSVILDGTNGSDSVQISGAGMDYSVVGLPATVTVHNSEPIDSLVVNTLGGDDGVDASGLPAGIVNLTIDAGAGNDSIVGSAGDDVLIGGDGNDFIQGNQGNDVILMGAGDDTFQWNPGDGSDTVEGQDGNDQMLFFGSNASENFDISANGSRVRFFRDIGNVTMDLNGIERVELRTLGGADNVVVNDLTGTDLNRLELGLRGPDGGPDGESDTITVNGTQGADTFGVAGDAGGLRVFGLSTAITIFDQDPALDRLTLNGLGGNDTISAQSLRAGSVQLAMNGGRRRRPADRQRRQRRHHRRPGQRHGPHGRRRRHLRLEPRRRQRHRRGAGRQRHPPVQRRQRQREHRHLGQRQPRPLLPRCRQRHHGPERDGGDRFQRPGRGRQRHRPRPDRHRPCRRSTSTWGPRAAAATVRPTASSSRGPAATT